jgi:hypothetical protein
MSGVLYCESDIAHSGAVSAWLMPGTLFREESAIRQRIPRSPNHLRVKWEGIAVVAMASMVIKRFREILRGEELHGESISMDGLLRGEKVFVESLSPWRNLS